jgi:hypothetical protein
MTQWRARDPVVRFRNWLVFSGWWDEQREKELRQSLRQQVWKSVQIVWVQGLRFLGFGVLRGLGLRFGISPSGSRY